MSFLPFGRVLHGFWPFWAACADVVGDLMDTADGGTCMTTEVRMKALNDAVKDNDFTDGDSEYTQINLKLK